MRLLWRKPWITCLMLQCGALDRGIESGISIRGFDARESPLYVDSIPIYVPYDGYVDLNRFLTSDIAEVQISKGYTSPLLGPNTLGGAVNLVTRVPEQKLDGDLGIGTGSGSQLNSWANLSSRWRNLYVLGSFGWLQSDNWPLSGNCCHSRPITPGRITRKAP